MVEASVTDLKRRKGSGSIYKSPRHLRITTLALVVGCT